MEEMEEASSSASSSSRSAVVPSSWTRSKILLVGVPPSARDEELKNHFDRYGDVVMATELFDDPLDSSSKVAFVLFADPDSVDRAVDEREKHNHIILGKKVEVRRLAYRLQRRRIELFNLPPGTTGDLLKAYFGNFGAVTEALTSSNGHGYVIFYSEESAREVLRKSFYDFHGTRVEVRKCSPRSSIPLSTNAPRHNLITNTATSSATPHACSVARRPRHTDSIRTTTRPNGAPHTPSYGRPMSATPYAYSVPNTPSLHIRPTSGTSDAYGVPNTPSLHTGPTSATPQAYNAPSFYGSITGTPYAYDVTVPSYVPYYSTYVCPNVMSTGNNNYEYNVPSTSNSNCEYYSTYVCPNVPSTSNSNYEYYSTYVCPNVPSTSNSNCEYYSTYVCPNVPSTSNSN